MGVYRIIVFEHGVLLDVVLRILDALVNIKIFHIGAIVHFAKKI